MRRFCPSLRAALPSRADHELARIAIAELWVDAASSSVAPSGSGGILRISYDQQAFEEGVREVILEPRSREGWERHRRGEGEGDGDEGTEKNEMKKDDEVKPQQQQKEVMPVNKDHLAFIVSCFHSSRLALGLSIPFR